MQGTQDSGTKPLTKLVQRNFPAIDYGFAYGSGVFVQPDLYEAHHKPGAASGPMLDFIFVVEDAQAWHTEVRAAACCLCVASPAPAETGTMLQHLGQAAKYSSCILWGERAMAAIGNSPCFFPASVACRTCRGTHHTTRF
jgi:hypothetical protein